MARDLTDHEKVEVFHKVAAAWQEKDWRTVADLMTPDGVLHSMMKDPIVGREVFYNHMVNLTAPNKQVRLNLHRIGVVDGALMVERTDEVTIDGVSRSVPVSSVLEFEGPLISYWREYYDRGQLLWAQGKAATPPYE